MNPSASGIHLIPYVREAQKRGAKLVMVDPRATPLARSADLHLAVRPGSDVAVALAIHRHLFTSGAADESFLREHTRGADKLRERAEEWTCARAAEVACWDCRCRAVRADVRGALAAVIRWGGSNATATAATAMAVLALPSRWKVRRAAAIPGNCVVEYRAAWISADEPTTRVVNKSTREFSRKSTIRL
jgi:anaerobic selenocysteine-containing dehydrogenase